MIMEQPDITIKVSGELLAQLEDWSPPVRVKIVKYADGYSMEAKTFDGHRCIFESQEVSDVFTDDEREVMIRCRCHDDAWHYWHPADPPYRCLVTRQEAGDVHQCSPSPYRGR